MVDKLKKGETVGGKTYRPPFFSSGAAASIVCCGGA
jgi:hypothetical protein